MHQNKSRHYIYLGMVETIGERSHTKMWEKEKLEEKEKSMLWFSIRMESNILVVRKVFLKIEEK